MLKVTYLFIVSSLLLITTSALGANEKKESNSISDLVCPNELSFSAEIIKVDFESIPTYSEGFQDGIREGKRLRAENNTTAYREFRNSYSSWPARYPHLTQYHDYYRGKYLGLIQGWEAETPGSGGIRPADTPECKWEGDDWICDDLN